MQAAAAHNASLLGDFFAAVPPLDWVTGFATHMAPVPLPDYTRLAAAGSARAGRSPLPIRQYPDLCHTVHAQYPVPEWHWAWAVAYTRNPITVLPFHMANILRQSANGSSPNIGFGGYSEGIGDDVNKAVWSLLAAEPNLSVPEVVRQYARYHFGSEHEDAMAAVILGLEQNWAGAIDSAASVGAVARTLAAAQSVEVQVNTSALAGNWRLQMLLYRSYFDAALQGRFQFEQAQQQQAYAALRRALLAGRGGGGTSVPVALAEAAGCLAGNDTRPEVALWRLRVFALARTINETVGASVLQSQTPDLNLGTFDTPLSDKAFVLAEIQRISALGRGNASSSQQRLQQREAIAALVDWDVAAAGGFFDKLGSAGSLSGRAPRLVTGQGAGQGGATTPDPAFFFTPHHQTLGQYDWHANHSTVAARVEWASFTTGQSQGAHPVELRYTGLDARASYTLSVLFFASEFKNFKAERNSVTAGATRLQTDALSPRPMRRVSFVVPRNETAGGELRVVCTSPASAGGVDGFETGGCSIVAVWLEPATPPSTLATAA